MCVIPMLKTSSQDPFIYKTILYMKCSHMRHVIATPCANYSWSVRHRGHKTRPVLSIQVTLPKTFSPDNFVDNPEDIIRK